jgi:hypothetical protein
MGHFLLTSLRLGSAAHPAWPKAVEDNHNQESQMAKAKRKSNGSRKTNGGSRRRGQSSSQDAISLLKSDHREVEGWFEQFEKARNEQRKVELAEKICNALKVHTTIEEEIFYPAFLEATQDEDVHHEAEIEHEGAKKLIVAIEERGADEYFDARISVLSEMIKHHVNEEEKRDGMFAKARASEMDLEELGAQLKARKQELMGKEGVSGRTFLESLRTGT